jgi:hypothetical protein
MVTREPTQVGLGTMHRSTNSRRSLTVLPRAIIGGGLLTHCSPLSGGRGGIISSTSGGWKIELEKEAPWLPPLRWFLMELKTLEAGTVERSCDKQGLAGWSWGIGHLKSPNFNKGRFSNGRALKGDLWRMGEAKRTTLELLDFRFLETRVQEHASSSSHLRNSSFQFRQPSLHRWKYTSKCVVVIRFREETISPTFLEAIEMPQITREKWKWQGLTHPMWNPPREPQITEWRAMPTDPSKRRNEERRKTASRKNDPWGEEGWCTEEPKWWKTSLLNLLPGLKSVNGHSPHLGHCGEGATGLGTRDSYQSAISASLSITERETKGSSEVKGSRGGRGGWAEWGARERSGA